MVLSYLGEDCQQMTGVQSVGLLVNEKLPSNYYVPGTGLGAGIKREQGTVPVPRWGRGEQAKLLET